MAKFSVKCILWKYDTNNRGESPIYIRITIAGKAKYISTGHYINPKLWDAKNEQLKAGHQLANEINADIADRRQKIARSIVDKNLNDKTVTSSQVKETFATKRNLHNYFQFVENYKLEVQHKRGGGTIDNYTKHAQKLKEYHGSEDLSFEQIDNDYLVKYEHWLRGKVGNNYTHKLLVSIRTIFNAAIKKQVIDFTPFKVFEMPKYVAPDKDYLSLAELNKLEKLARETTNKSIKQTATYLLLGCYTGLRIGDWFTFDPVKNIRDGRVFLRAGKNKEWVTMPVVSRLKRFLPHLQQVALTITEPEINRTLKTIAAKLNINKHLTSHTGRHTFAITLCAEQGISSETCAELMGITVATCVENYYVVTNRKIDKETIKAWEGL